MSNRKLAWKRDYQSFQRRLITAREDAGLSQREAADRIGVSQSWIAQRETGQLRCDFVELVRLARLYHKSLDYFAPFLDH